MTSFGAVRRALSVSLVLAMVAPARVAFAQAPARDHAQADALFSEGRDLLEKGRFAEACAKLSQSEALAPAVGTLLNLGYCWEQVGKLRSAMDAYAEAETLALAAGEAKRAAFAKERFAAVEPRAPRLIVRVIPPEAPGLEVKRNGAPLAKTDLDIPIAVDPQDYVVTATAPGHAGWTGGIIVRGEGAVVTILVPPLGDGGGAAGSPAAPLGPGRIAALGLGALSALAIGGGIAAALSAKSRYNDASSHCDDSGCDETGTSIEHGAVVQGNIATALIGLGALAGAAGIYLWVASGPPERKSPPRSVRASVSPFGAALGGTF